MRARRIEIGPLVECLESAYGRPRFITRFDPLEELVSCILSQHTTDAKSFPAFTRLKETFPSWHDLVEAGAEGLAPVIRTAGLANQKAANIVRCLERIRECFGDYTLEPLRNAPMLEARTWLQTLPGVGPKTASIVLCFSFGKGAIPVDTHVFRVSWRLGLIDQKIGEAKAHDALLAIVPGELAYRFHTSLIQHGRLTCRAPLPSCEDCAVADRCAWLAKGGPDTRRTELRRARSGRASKP